MIKNIYNKHTKFIDKKNILESMYLFILALYLIRVFFDTTMFSLPWPTRYFDFVRLGIGGYLVAKVALSGYKNIGEYLLEIIYLLVFSLIYRGTGYLFLLELAFLVLEAKDIHYKKILGLYLLIGSSIMIITMIGALTGCIKDLIYVDDGMYKHAFGIVFTTDFGAHIFFLILAYLAYKDKTPGIVLNILLIIIAFILYIYSGTRNSSGSLLLLFLGNLYVSSTDKVLNKENDRNDKIKVIKLRLIKFIDYCLVLSVPILSFLVIIATISYSADNKILSIINLVVSGRLDLGKTAIQNYGISLWGNPFDMIGAGGDTVWRSDYNFVDSSYVMIFIRYGLVLFILTVIAFTWISIKAKKSGKRYLLIILCSMAIQCTIEHHMLEIAYNPFVLFAFLKINRLENYTALSISKDRKRALIQSVPILAVSIIFLFKYNELLAYGRTIVQLLKLSDSTRNIYFIISVFLSLVIVIITITAVQNLLYNVAERGYKRNVCKWAILSCVGGISLCISFQMGKELIKQRTEYYLASVESVTAILKSLSIKSKYTLYIDHIPYLYMTNQEGFDNIIPGCPYRKRDNNAVVVADSSTEITYLLRSGYVCGRITENEYIYTNDQTIASSLKTLGIAMNDYYAEKTDVNLTSLAEANDLSLDSNGRVLIDGINKSLIHGPWVTIYRGRLSVDFNLTLVDTEIVEGKVATLRLSCGSGAKVLKEIVLNKKDFDDNGQLLTSIIYDIPDSEGYEFLIFAEGNTKIRLNSLMYGKVRR